MHENRCGYVGGYLMCATADDNMTTTRRSAPDVQVYRFKLVLLISWIIIFTTNDGVQAENEELNNEIVAKVDPKRSIVWGPGIIADVVLPARYIVVQLVDKDGNNMTQSVGDNPFVVTITGTGHRGKTRVWKRTTDRNDGSYVIQYKLYDSWDTLTVEIVLNGIHVAKSPYLLEGPVYHEKCYCPNPSFDDWMKTMSCYNFTYTQIENDLQLFDRIDMRVAEKEIIQKFNIKGAHSLCHYVIKDNKIYRRTFGEHVGFKMFMDAMLLSLTRKVSMPDFEFFVNLGDWPLAKNTFPQPLPIFSWCGSDDTHDIVMPTYDVTESTLETLGRVALDLVSVQGAKAPKWPDKSPLAFWRGRDSRQERLDLVRMSHKYPDVIDARLTNMFFFKKEDDLGELVKHISFFDFFKYKYQINIDGTVAAYRLPYLLGGDSLVLKQDSPYYEHFYKQLKPFEHYIPFKRDLSDLLDVIQWAKDNDEKAQNISDNARQFVRHNLMADNIYCYHAVLFKEYAKRLTQPVKVQENMELVQQPDDRDSECECKRKRKEHRDEL